MPGIRTPLGNPRQQPQLSGHGFPGGQVLTPVSTLEDSSVCRSMWQSPPVPSPEVRACVGSRSGKPGFESHASHFWLLDWGCDAQTLRTSILRISPAQGSQQWWLPRGPGEVPGRPWAGRKGSANWGHYYHSQLPQPCLSTLRGTRDFMTPSSTSAGFPFDFGSGSSKPK